MSDFNFFRETRLEPVGQRLKRLVQQLRGGHSVKSQRVYRVEVGGRTLKRIAFSTTERAKGIAERLRHFRGRQIFPDLIAQHGQDVWVDFLEGEPVAHLSPEILSGLARIFATLYTRAPTLVAIEEGPWLAELESNLCFLGDAGVLPAPLQARLQERLEEATPSKVWVGFDYSDPRAANLLACSDGSIRFIDIESLSAPNALLGSGVAKASYRWLGDAREQLVGLLQMHEIPPILEAMPFVELHSLAGWTVRSMLQRKPRLVRPELFEKLAERDWGEGGVRR